MQNIPYTGEPGWGGKWELKSSSSLFSPHLCWEKEATCNFHQATAILQIPAPVGLHQPRAHSFLFYTKVLHGLVVAILKSHITQEEGRKGTKQGWMPPSISCLCHFFLIYPRMRESQDWRRETNPNPDTHRMLGMQLSLLQHDVRNNWPSRFKQLHRQEMYDLPRQPILRKILPYNDLKYICLLIIFTLTGSVLGLQGTSRIVLPHDRSFSSWSPVWCFSKAITFSLRPGQRK